MGWVIEEYNRAQITMNLTNYKITPPHEVLEAAREEARKRGIVLTGSEIVGVIPYEAMRRAGVFYRRRMMKNTGIPIPDIVETAIQSMGLTEVGSFDPAEKVLGLPKVEGPLVLRRTYDFVDEVSRDSAAPGGGSVAALAGSLGAALASMVANLSVGKVEFDDHYDVLCSIAERAQALKDALVRGVDEDTMAFDSVLQAMRMPKDTEKELAVRAVAMQEGYKAATRVPLRTVEQCRDALALCLEIARLADPGMISDAGSGSLMAHAGVQAAAYNVRINLPQIEDKAFHEEMNQELDKLLAESAELAKQVAAEVEKKLAT
jgi:glutamate formiminotransferase/formiminotetrahydrofolate cyclodeaminase